MKTISKIQWALLTSVAAVCFTVPAMADSMTPQPVHEGNATFITGGIGIDEQKALEASAKNYNLEITNADKAGDFTADTDLVIKSKGGREILNVYNAGPLFYAKLPTGEYIIQATEGGEHRVRDVKVSASKPTDVHLIWKQI